MSIRGKSATILRNNHENPKMKDIKDHLPLLSIGLLVISLFRLILFYNVFNINILDYVDLGEVIALSFSALLPTFAMLLVLGVGFYFTQNAEVFTKYNPARFIAIQEPKAFGERFRLFVADTGKTLALSPLLVLIVSVVLFFINKDLSHRFFHLSLFFFVWIYYGLLLLEIARMYKLTTGAYPSHSSMSIAKAVIFTSLITVASAVFNAQMSRDKLDYERVVVGMGNKIIKSSSTYRYVGKTKSYIFFYNKANHSYNAYNLSMVDSLSVNNQSFDINSTVLKPEQPPVVIPTSKRALQPLKNKKSRPIESGDSLRITKQIK